MTIDKITLGGVYARIKGVIADIKNIPRREVMADNDLRDDLGFTTPGVRALALHVSDAFADLKVTVSRDEMAGCTTVRDVSWLVWDKVPSSSKEDES